MKFNFTLTKSYLQLGASYSHMKNHLKALKCGEKSLESLNAVLKSIEYLLRNKNKKIFNIKENKENENLMRKNEDLKKSFFFLFEKLKIINDFCFEFFKNHENKKEMLKASEFKKFEKLDIPVISKKLEPEWLDKITIGNFMHVEYVYIEKLNLPIMFEEIFSEGFISILICLISMIYFLISTENRFFLLEKNELSENKNFKIKAVFEKNHFEKLKKMKNFVFSEFLHAKIVYLLKSFFNINPLLTHLMSSFYNNYDTNLKLEKIVEVEESLITTTYNPLSCTDTMVEYKFDIYSPDKNNYQDESVSDSKKFKFSKKNIEKKEIIKIDSKNYFKNNIQNYVNSEIKKFNKKNLFKKEKKKYFSKVFKSKNKNNIKNDKKNSLINSHYANILKKFDNIIEKKKKLKSKNKIKKKTLNFDLIFSSEKERNTIKKVKKKKKLI